MFGYCQKFERGAKILGTFVMQQIVQAMRFLKKQSFGKDKCDMLGTIGQYGRFVIALLTSSGSACAAVVHWLHKLGTKKYLQNITN